MKVTENILTYAHNVDITETTPGIYDHEFPRYWYHATVTGRYAKASATRAKNYFTAAEQSNTALHAISKREGKHWKNSLKLPMGNTVTKLKNPHRR